MQEPELEEEALTATGNGRTLSIRRQTMGDNPGMADITTPSGKTLRTKLARSKPGLLRAHSRRMRSAFSASGMAIWKPSPMSVLSMRRNLPIVFRQWIG